MTLERPEFLWCLLAAPLLWWLSRPPAPRQRLWTAHHEQWRLALQTLRRRPPRGSWLRLLLLLVALAAAALAAAGPRSAATAGPTQLVVLFDASLSMAARSGGSSAHARARALAERRLASLPAHVEVRLLRCGGDLVRRYGDAARRLTDLGAPAGPLDVDLAQLVDALYDAETETWLLTDGQAQVRTPDRGALDVLDARGENASITAVRVEDSWPLPQLAVEVSAAVHAAADAEVYLVARGAFAGGEERRLLSWRDGQPATARFELQREAAGGELELRVELAADALSEDDARVVELPPLPAPRVAVLADEDAGPFAAVAADALAEEVGGRVVPATAGGEVGLLLVDGGAVDLAPGEARVMTFGATLAGQRDPEAWEPPGALDWDRGHPLTRGLDLSELRVDRAWRGVLPEGEAVIWAVEDGRREPLAVLAQGDGVASLHFAFRLRDGNLPLLAAFPQLLRRGFVSSYGQDVLVEVDSSSLPEEELDLRYAQPAASRPLRAFGAPGESLARWCVAVGLVALGLRALFR